MADDKNEISPAESSIMSNSGIHSTPLSTGSSRSNDEIINFWSNMMNNINENSLKHFNELRGDINNIDEKFDKWLSDSQKHFNDMKEVKQNTSLVKQFDKHLNEISDSQKQIIKRCDNIIENMKEQAEKWKRDTDKFNENKNKQVIDVYKRQVVHSDALPTQDH